MGYIVVGPDGTEHGPVEVATLVEWAKAGTLPANAPVRDLESGKTYKASEMIELAPYVSAYSQPPGPAGTSKGSAMMPSRNPDALWGYYLGWLSLICFCGLPASPFAIWRSVRGLRAFRDDPSVYGKAHAIVGIVLASVGAAGNIGLWVLVAVGARFGD